MHKRQMPFLSLRSSWRVNQRSGAEKETKHFYLSSICDVVLEFWLYTTHCQQCSYFQISIYYLWIFLTSKIILVWLCEFKISEYVVEWVGPSTCFIVTHFLLREHIKETLSEYLLVNFGLFWSFLYVFCKL